MRGLVRALTSLRGAGLCHGLNVSPQIHMLKPGPRGDSVGRWGLGRDCTMRVDLLWMGLVPYRRPWASPLPSLQCADTVNQEWTHQTLTLLRP